MNGNKAFRIYLTWFRVFVRDNLNWSYKNVTRIGEKLLEEWEAQELKTARFFFFLVKAYSIPPHLFVNNDQTCIHLVPTWGAYTWDVKG